MTMACICLTLCVATTGTSSKSRQTKVAVLEFETGGGVEKNTGRVFSELVANEVRERGYKVISSQDIEKMVGLEEDRQSLGCTSSGCLAEIGGALGVDEILSGQVANLGSYLIITLKRISQRRGEVIKQVTRKFQRASGDVWVEMVTPLVDELYGAPPPGTQKPNAVQATTPVYKRWWLWTTVGVVVAGAAAATAIIVVTANPTPKTDLGVVRF